MGKKKEKQVLNLSKLIQKRLLFTFLGVFLLTVIVTLVSERNKALANAKSLINDAIYDVEIHLDNTVFSDLVNRATNLLYKGGENDDLYSKTVEELGDYNGDGKINDDDVNEYLYELAINSGIWEVNIIDENGIIRYSTIPEYRGFDMINGGSQSKTFYENTRNNRYWSMQPLLPISYDDNNQTFYIGLFFTNGFGLLKDNWMLQVGAGEEEVLQIKRNNIHYVPSSHRVGDDGTVLAIETTNYYGDDKNYYSIVGMTGEIPEQDESDTYITESLIKGLEKSKEGELFPLEFDDEKSFALYKKIGGLIMVGVISKDEAFKEAYYLMGFMIIVEMIIFSLLYVIVFLFLDGEVVDKIKAISESLSDISKGNLEGRAEVRTTVEFERLSDDINATVDTLKEYITEAETRIDRELSIARAIQNSALPRVFHDNEDFGIYASMTPAKEVGGDFYDFFMLDDDHLGFLIADVSGKGIPAAMFMMNVKTMINDRAKQGGTPGEIITDVNKNLCENEDNDYFVTVWFAIIELSTGKGLSTNAGHEHPVLKSGIGTYEMVKYNHMPPVAVYDTLKFPDREFALNAGDCIFVYTDGVTEAEDKDNHMFGEGRLLETLNENDSDNMEEVVKGVKAGIDAFAGEVEQFDDITMLAFIYKGKKYSN